MANGSHVSLPQGFDLDATKAREALTFDDIRDIAKWSSAWWQSATDTDG